MAPCDLRRLVARGPTLLACATPQVDPGGSPTQPAATGPHASCAARPRTVLRTGVDKSGDRSARRDSRGASIVRATTGGERGPVADQPGDSGRSGTASSPTLRRVRRVRPALSPQQRAFLRLTRPLGLIDGTALLAAPSEFAKDAIERILRRPISDALGRHLGRHGQPRRRRRRLGRVRRHRGARPAGAPARPGALRADGIDGAGGPRHRRRRARPTSPRAPTASRCRPTSAPLAGGRRRPTARTPTASAPGSRRRRGVPPRSGRRYSGPPAAEPSRRARRPG